MVTIAVIGMGEMGSGVAQRLVGGGARVLTPLAGRSAATLERAKSAGVEDAADAELVEAADMILSIIPPSEAPATAARLAPIIAASNRRPVLIDCNAIAPQTFHALAKPFLDQDLRIGDGSIIGGPPRPGYSPRLFLSGAVADEAHTLAALGLDASLLSDTLGDASALKMSYAGITKGMQAIGSAMILGAARAGASQAFAAELQSSLPDIHGWLQRSLPAMPAKAYRWDGEMLEIAKFLEPEQGASEMLSGAAALYRHVAEAQREGPQSEIIAILQAFLRPAP